MTPHHWKCKGPVAAHVKGVSQQAPFFWVIWISRPSLLGAHSPQPALPTFADFLPHLPIVLQFLHRPPAPTHIVSLKALAGSALLCACVAPFAGSRSGSCSENLVLYSAFFSFPRGESALPFPADKRLWYYLLFRVTIRLSFHSSLQQFLPPWGHDNYLQSFAW